MPARTAQPLERRRPGVFAEYSIDGAFDEMFVRPGEPHACCRRIHGELLRLPPAELWRRQQAANLYFLHQGITFNLHDADREAERIFPNDLIPRVLPDDEWRRIEEGVTQRLTALNLFLDDVYTDGRILRDGVVPPSLVHSCGHFRHEMRGLRVPHGRHVTVSGTDLVRLPDGEFVVLDDNLRAPSGASYMLANRQVLKRVFPTLFHDHVVRSVDHYSQALLATLCELAPAGCTEPRVVLLTPGVYNPAFFEHAYLARHMGIELVEGNDLTVHGNVVYTRTIAGLERVDVIYRRIDDDFIDPLAFRKESQLGAAGLFNAYRAGNVAIANAIGTGVADDRAIYAHVPEIIRYYLDQDPLLANVPTFLPTRREDRAHVLQHLEDLVVKRVNATGSGTILVGPTSTSAERAEIRARILDDPRQFIAQPALSLSRAPCLIDQSIESRHIDLRVFVLQGEKTRVIPGGLTRVALGEGSLVVNSFEGGGSKDTWVLESPLVPPPPSEGAPSAFTRS